MITIKMDPEQKNEHVHVKIYAGHEGDAETHGKLGYIGNVIMRVDEWHASLAMMHVGARNRPGIRFVEVVHEGGIISEIVSMKKKKPPKRRRKNDRRKQQPGAGTGTGGVGGTG